MADLQRVDMGIAMCHFELAVREAGIEGRWVTDQPLPENSLRWDKHGQLGELGAAYGSQERCDGLKSCITLVTSSDHAWSNWQNGEVYAVPPSPLSGCDLRP